MLTAVVGIAAFTVGAIAGAVFVACAAGPKITALTNQIRERDTALRALTKERGQ